MPLQPETERIWSPAIGTNAHREAGMSNDRAARGKKIRDQAFGKDGRKSWDELNAISRTGRACDRCSGRAASLAKTNPTSPLEVVF
jgi:hypothetical protein